MKGEGLGPAALFPSSVLLFANHLMIPSVVSALQVSAAQQNGAQIASVGLAAAFYLLIDSYIPLADKVYWSNTSLIVKYLSVPCLYANIHFVSMFSEECIAMKFGINPNVEKADTLYGSNYCKFCCWLLTSLGSFTLRNTAVSEITQCF